MKNVMSDAFKDLAEGDFENGLGKLYDDDQWCDDIERLDGPFYLGFPGAPGWGEGLLLASLLKRHAADTEKQIKVFAQEPVCSILKQDHAFCVRPAENIDQARSCGARSPLAILWHALTGDLLDLPFVKIDIAATCPQSSRAKPRIGIAWASSPGNYPVPNKSMPLENFLYILGNVDVEVISFQRKLQINDREILCDRFKGCCSIIDDLYAPDQKDILREIRDLNCMVTISTTTAHIAACIGVPVVLLAAKRKGPQWFWRAQAEHGKCFYPNLDVILGSPPDEPGHWWKGCLKPAKCAFLRKLSTHA